MTGGVGVLIACACAAMLLLAWQLVRARASAKSIEETATPDGSAGPESVADGALDASKSLPVSVRTALASASEPADSRDDDAIDDRLSLAAQSGSVAEQEMRTDGVSPPVDAGDRNQEDSANTSLPEPDEYLETIAPRSVPDASAGEETETTDSALDPKSSTAVVAALIEPSATPMSASGEREAPPASAEIADHSDHVSVPISERSTVTEPSDGDAAGSTLRDAFQAGPPAEAPTPDDADGHEVDEIKASTASVAALAVEQSDCEGAGATADAPEPAERYRRPAKPAQHRDRRGQRRVIQRSAASQKPQAASVPIGAPRPPAEARLRLELHPIRRTVTLAAVLARPEGFPGTLQIELEGEQEIAAYDEARYDDLPLDWSDDLLAGEFRVDSREGYQWLRSARQVHLFQELPEEVGLLSTGAAKAGQQQAVVCSISDADAVRAAAAACGSSPQSLDDSWSGVPSGWIVLSNYRPVHSPAEPLPPGLSSMDPGLAIEIRLVGGLVVRGGHYAKGHGPRIEIDGLPEAAQVTIDGCPATQDDGAWIAQGWCDPGQHLIDVVPGPSASYRIVDDPWATGGWEPWEAHPGRFGTEAGAPWHQVEICGARLSGPGGRHVVAAPSSLSVVLLGLARGVTTLRPRDGVGVTIALAAEAPAFLISSSGPRRAQGRVEWLSPGVPESRGRGIDLGWVAIVRLAAARRLPIDNPSAAAVRAWQRARERARRHRKARL